MFVLSVDLILKNHAAQLLSTNYTVPLLLHINTLRLGLEDSLLSAYGF